MDTFFEQIVPIRKTGKTLLGVIGIWGLAIFITVFLFLFGRILGAFSSLAPIIILAALYGAFKLTGNFNIEYEYIITNGSMDIDKIINKSSRKRMASIELSGVSRLEKFNANLISNIDKQKLVVACNTDDPDAYLMVCEREGKGALTIVFAPDERLRGAIVKFVPKFIANSAFK